MRRSTSLLVVVLFGIASCQGIQERVDVLRAKRVEIVDDNEKVTVDVGRDVRLLAERVAKLEAELRAVKAEAELVKARAAPAASDSAGQDAAPRDAGRSPASLPPPKRGQDPTPSVPAAPKPQSRGLDPGF